LRLASGDSTPGTAAKPPYCEAAWACDAWVSREAALEFEPRSSKKQSPTPAGPLHVCMVVDWVVAAIIVGEIAAGVHFG
jgi:hypothetical protein